MLNTLINHLKDKQSVTDELMKESNQIYDESTNVLNEMKKTEEIANNFMSDHEVCNSHIQHFKSIAKTQVDTFCSVSTVFFINLFQFFLTFLISDFLFRLLKKQNVLIQ